MQTKGKKVLENISPMAQVMAELIEKHGGKAAVARKMGIPEGKKFKAMQVKLGHYEAGRSKPKGDFLDMWKEAFGDDLTAMEKEIKGSSWNKKEQIITPVPESGIMKKDPGEEVRILIKNLDRMGELNEYLLRELKNYQDKFGRI